MHLQGWEEAGLYQSGLEVAQFGRHITCHPEVGVLNIPSKVKHYSGLWSLPALPGYMLASDVSNSCKSPVDE